MANGNEPAFPSGYVGIGDGDSQAFTPGLTKREAFAMAAMQGIMARSTSTTVFYDDVAQIAVKAADALIKALGGENG